MLILTYAVATISSPSVLGHADVIAQCDGHHSISWRDAAQAHETEAHLPGADAMTCETLYLPPVHAVPGCDTMSAAQRLRPPLAATSRAKVAAQKAGESR